MPVSETRTESVARELLAIRGWKTTAPPRGNLLWKNEYRGYPHLLEAMKGNGKKGLGGDGYPDFIVVDHETIQPLIVGETKADESEIGLASHEASEIYGEAFRSTGHDVLAAGIAGDDNGNIAVQISKRNSNGWQPIEYKSKPIQWLPTPDEAGLLLADASLFDLMPRVPSPEVLAKTGEEINRTLRECKIADPLRPAIMGALMLAIWQSRGQLRNDPRHVLHDINDSTREAFVNAGKSDIADSLSVPTDNAKLAAQAPRILHTLRLLNVTTLTAEHDYLGQLYETFFRFTGGNTIGQYFTPRHITEFMTSVCQVTRNDLVVDPACGSGGFLIASLTRMLEGTHLTAPQINSMVKKHIKGFETEPITAALCVANMILRGDGKTGIYKGDCFTDPNFPEGEATVVLGNPPFPHAKTDQPAERFVDRGLEALGTRGKLAMVVPGSLLVKGNKAKWRKKTLKENTLHAVITLPADLFQPYASATTAILVLERGIPQSTKTPTFFCHISNDGLRLKKNTRVPQSGNQLPLAMAAFFERKSHTGFCSWKRLEGISTGAEWAPGAYIDASAHSSDDLTSEADWLIRSQVSFYAHRAPEIDRFVNLKPADAAMPRPYSQMSRRRPKDYGHGDDTVGALFNIAYGQKSLHSKENLAPGPNMVVSSSGMDNGCYGFFDFDDLIQAPFVTVPSTGSIAEAFVQTLPCGVTDDCLILTPKPGTDEEDLYIAAAVLRLEKWRFNYGRKATPERIAHMRMDRDATLKGHIRSRRSSATALISQAQTLLSVGDFSISQVVKKLAAKWRKDTHFSSSLSAITLHPAYQRIIGLGPIAIPFVLEEMSVRPGHWFHALDSLTQGAGPSSEAQSLTDATARWLAWGKEKGYR